MHTHMSEIDHGGEGGGSPLILDPLAGRCRTCFALCLYATEPHIAHYMLLEQFILNNIFLWQPPKLFPDLLYLNSSPI